ncbi:MAG: threonylcarbamoyl-AMP synthase [Bacteroidales bacterium]|nr:threonylcarbamoyl-AMP synthase [Bacteroidales bacterium]
MIFEDDIKNSLNILKAGGVILYPTDTIWGLGCDATRGTAVDKIFGIKSRNEGRSLIVLVSNETMIERYVNEVPGIAYDLISVADKPITIIYPEGKNLAAGVCDTDGSVGIRICTDEFCRQLIARFRKPIISTSANISGAPAPAHFGEIDRKIISSADYVVKYRQDDRQKQSPSPVIKIDKNGVFRILRM